MFLSNEDSYFAQNETNEFNSDARYEAIEDEKLLYEGTDLEDAPIENLVTLYPDLTFYKEDGIKTSTEEIVSHPEPNAEVLAFTSQTQTEYSEYNSELGDEAMDEEKLLDESDIDISNVPFMNEEDYFETTANDDEKLLDESDIDINNVSFMNEEDYFGTTADEDYEMDTSTEDAIVSGDGISGSIQNSCIFQTDFHESSVETKAERLVLELDHLLDRNDSGYNVNYDSVIGNFSDQTDDMEITEWGNFKDEKLKQNIESFEEFSPIYNREFGEYSRDENEIYIESLLYHESPALHSWWNRISTLYGL